MIYDVKHLFNGLFAICIFFLRQSIHNFCPFFRLFIVGLYKLFIFDSCSLSQVSFSNIFPVCSLSSHFLEVVFSKVETFQFNEVQVNQFCLSWTLPFVLCLKSPCHSQSHLHFLYAIFWGCILHFCLWPFLTEACEGVKVCVCLYFPMWMSNSGTVLWKDCFLLKMNRLYLCRSISGISVPIYLSVLLQYHTLWDLQFYIISWHWIILVFKFCSLVQN